ncbi:hypothetical protein [Ancylobacter sp. IITR112]|uniref:hypothetical protein n=1 Tax=Ancylobacter sp. IITR112 TaxID=3138073 RepID=UPI00352B4591
MDKGEAGALVDDAEAGPLALGKRPWEVPTLDIRPLAAAEVENSATTEDGQSS